eukprot:tig00001160_g7346.t1
MATSAISIPLLLRSPAVKAPSFSITRVAVAGAGASTPGSPSTRATAPSSPPRPPDAPGPPRPAPAPASPRGPDAPVPPADGAGRAGAGGGVRGGVGYDLELEVRSAGGAFDAFTLVGAFAWRPAAAPPPVPSPPCVSFWWPRARARAARVSARSSIVEDQPCTNDGCECTWCPANAPRNASGYCVPILYMYNHNKAIGVGRTQQSFCEPPAANASGICVYPASADGAAATARCA